MKEYLELACTPLSEDCVQVRPDRNYLPEMKKEVQRFKEMLETRFPIPENLIGQFGFSIKRNNHDFGMYMEVCCWFNDNNETAEDFAYFVESNLPETWDDKDILNFNSNND